MSKHGFAMESFLSWWFIVYFFIRIVAMFGQLYIFSSVELGKTMALFGAVSIIMANLLGFLLLKEVLTPAEYFGVSLVVVAFIVLAVT
jgi:multidrug transporter EmrE-like cation transporter